MAKQIGPHFRIGFIDGKIYYKMNGEYYMRNPSAPSKTKIKKDPAFKSLHNYSKEFGAASSVGSCFKKTFGPVLDHVSDRNLTRRFSSVFAQMIHKGQGEHGKRSIEILPNKDLLCGFQFKEKLPFDQVFKARYSLKAGKGRKEVTLKVPSFSVKNGMAKAPGASHFRLVLCLVAFSDYAYHAKSKSYLPVEATLNRMCVPAYSKLVSMADKTEALSLKASLNAPAALPETVGVVCSGSYRCGVLSGSGRGILYS
jgi:hypothetical protein